MIRPQKESLIQVQQQRLQQRVNPQNVALGRMLEMSLPELEEEVRREIDENPALEVSESNDVDNQPYTETSDDLQRADYADDDDVPMSFSSQNRNYDYIYNVMAATADDGDTLIDALMKRLDSEFDLSDNEQRIAEHIIGNIDSNGYITRSIADITDDIAISEGLDVDQAEVSKVFKDIRKLDPAGIGAVDLRDCLLLQIQRLEPTAVSRTAHTIIADYFDLFSKKHYDRLLAELEIDKDSLAEALNLIKGLNPKPASTLDLTHDNERARHISPDIALDYDPESHDFTFTLLGNIPELTIEESFNADDNMVPKLSDNTAAKNHQKQALAFIRKKRDDARNFISLLQMRALTLLTITKAIVAHQKSFFITGDNADIKPMVLRDIAAATGLDISVISRATTGKYILTNFGIYPLKHFFNEKLDGDADVSSHEILKHIKDLIDNEDKGQPLNDQAITDALNAQGYDLARRTVAKYREKLGFPVARLRKEL